MPYAQHFSTRQTPQSEPIPGSRQVPNSASGFAVGPVERQVPEAIGNQLLHTVVPLLAVLDWLLFDIRGRYRWRYAAYWLAFPLAYLGFALLRGLVVHRYPYPFIDVRDLGYPGVAVSAVVFAVAFWVLGLVFVVIDRALSGRLRRTPDQVSNDGPGSSAGDGHARSVPGAAGGRQSPG